MNDILIKILGSASTESERDLYRQTHIGNESGHICLDCAHIGLLDPKRDNMRCSKCGSNNLSETFKLEGHACPSCGKGVFHGDMTMIS